MRITIDNFDGLGALDYSEWVSTAGPLKVHRKLNAPSLCECTMDLSAATLRAPLRKGRVIVQRDEGEVLFTGYLAREPEQIYAGAGTSGAAYLLGLSFVSDEWLLDRQGAQAAGAPGLAQSGAAAMKALTARAGLAAFYVARADGVGGLGVFRPEQNGSWSANAGAIAGSVSAAYRVVGGVVELQPAGTVTHTLNDDDGSLQVANLRMSQRRDLANDVTVSGEREAGTYISESFAGDGTTSDFLLTKVPFHPTGSGVSGKVISDNFDQGQFDRAMWSVSDPGSHFSFSASGLSLSGGNGLDGQTTLISANDVELGGSLVFELGSVRLGPGSDGVLCALYSGDTNRQSCFAGYNVRQSEGSTVLMPLVWGAEVGSAYTLQSGHVYTLRVRVHSAAVQRVRQIFYAMVQGEVRSFGGGLVDAPVDLVFDLQDLGASSNTPATILYAGTLATSPASCSFGPVNSVQLIGSVGSCSMTQTGTVWVTKTSSTGVKTTLLTGGAGEGVDGTVSASGKLTFLPGRIPQAGELVTVSYRSSQRAIARVQDPAAVAAEAASGIPGTAQWLGRVVQPTARSTEDCESAAQALVSVAADVAEAVGGTYVAVNSADMWPGDVLALSRGGTTVRLIVRDVTIEDGLAAPELVTYHVTFAGEWAEALGIRVSDAVATDVLLPQMAQPGVGTFLPNLLELNLVSASGTVLQVDAGVTPPAGGGFEVRRRDGGFGAAGDQDLVLRSPVRGFSIPREGPVEQYFVRMYDASSPPVYSRVSSALFVSAPVD